MGNTEWNREIHIRNGDRKKLFLETEQQDSVTASGFPY